MAGTNDATTLPTACPSAHGRTIFGVRNPTHQAVGAASTLAVCAAVDCRPLATIVAVCASVLGSRLPDVDQPGARIHRRTRLERRGLVARLAGHVLRLPMTIFAVFAKHRGATHWLLSGAATTVVLAGAAGALWPPLQLPVFIGVGCGYCAHLLADACTPHGAPLLGPLSACYIHLLPPQMRVMTGGAGDLLVLIAATLTAATLGLLVLQAT